MITSRSNVRALIYFIHISLPVNIQFYETFIAIKIRDSIQSSWVIIMIEKFEDNN